MEHFNNKKIILKNKSKKPTIRDLASLESSKEVTNAVKLKKSLYL